jgi:nitroreductase
MDFWELVRRRRSVRSYDPNADVSPEQVKRILEAAIKAPSAGNRQPWHLVVVRDQALRQELVQAAYGQGFLARAPVVIAVYCDPARSAGRYGERGSSLYCLQDTAAVTEHILLAATALGLGSCWVGAFDEAAVARTLDLPGHLRPVALVSIGHPFAPSSRRTSRRPLDEVVSFR